MKLMARNATYTLQPQHITSMATSLIVSPYIPVDIDVVDLHVYWWTFIPLGPILIIRALEGMAYARSGEFLGPITSCG